MCLFHHPCLVEDDGRDLRWEVFLISAGEAGCRLGMRVVLGRIDPCMHRSREAEDEEAAHALALEGVSGRVRVVDGM